MARTRVIKAGFNRGEIDPTLQRRHDLEWYAFSCDKARNAVPLPQGGVVRGPGTRFRAELPATVMGDARLVPFRFSTDQRYLLCFAAYEFHVYKAGALVYSGAGPWAEDQLGALSFAQNLDTLIVSHADFPPRRIQRQGADDAWALDEMPISARPIDAFARRTYSVAYSAAGGGSGATLPYYVVGVVHVDTSGLSFVTGDTTAGSQTIASVVNGQALSPGSRFTLSGEGAEIFTVLSVDATATSIIADKAPGTTATQTFTPYEFDPDDKGKFIRFPDGAFVEIYEVSAPNLAWVRSIRAGSETFGTARPPGTWQILANAWGRFRPQGPATATTVSSVAVAGDASVVVSSATGLSINDFVEFGAIDNRVFRVTSVSGTTLGLSPALTMPLAVGGEVYKSRGYPGASAFVEGRLVFGGSKSLPSTVFASAVNDFTDFQTASAEDDDPIAYPIIGSDVPAIRHIAQGRHLFFLTDAGPYYVPKSDQQPLTPATFSARRTSEQRPVVSVRPIESEGALLFAEDGGLSVRALVYTDTEAAYNALDLTRDGRHLLTGIRDMALRRSDPTIGSDLLYIVDEAGHIVIVTLARGENVTGFCKRVSRDAFDATAFDGDSVFVLTSRQERNLGSATRRFLEEFDFSYLLENAVQGTVSSATDTVSGLDHLNKRTCDVIADDVYLGQVNVYLGQATFPRDIEATYEIGIPFGEVYDSDFQARYPTATAAQVWVRTQPVDFGPPNPTLMGKRKRVSAVTVSLQDTRHVRVNNRPVAFRTAGSSVLDDPVPLFTGEKRIAGMMGWGLDGQVDITQTEPAPLTLRALAVEVWV